MALNKAKGHIQRMFDKSLADLIRGIRNNKDNEVEIATSLLQTSSLLNNSLHLDAFYRSLRGRNQAWIETGQFDDENNGYREIMLREFLNFLKLFLFASFVLYF